MSFYLRCLGCFTNILTYPFGLLIPLEYHFINFTNDIPFHTVRVGTSEGNLQSTSALASLSGFLSRFPGSLSQLGLGDSSLFILWNNTHLANSEAFFFFRIRNVTYRLCIHIDCKVSTFYTDLQMSAYLYVSSFRLYQSGKQSHYKNYGTKGFIPGIIF